MAFALTLVAPVGGISAAAAATQEDPSATTIGKVKDHDDGTATVKARYICPEGEGWHLWVSAKQTADGSKGEDVTGEGAGFGGVAATWLQRHPTTFSCDGKRHTQKSRSTRSRKTPSRDHRLRRPRPRLRLGSVLPHQRGCGTLPDRPALGQGPLVRPL